MDILRTPDERFSGLPGYNFEPRYVEVDGVRIHYIDEGSVDGAPVLMIHGEPSWCYLYRKMMRPIAAAGYRAVAPDLPGFGRSDKPARREDYTYQRHVDWMRGFIEALDLRDITLVGQDWGGLIGLRVAAESEERFARIVAANTFLPTGDRSPGEAFLRWQQFSQTAPEFEIGNIVQRGTVTELPPGVVAAYDAPFPDDSYKAGARQFPVLVPTSPDDPAAPANRAAWEVLRRWEKPFLTAFSDSARSPTAPIASSRTTCPAREDSCTRRSRAPDTSSRRTRAKSWRRPSSTSLPRRREGCARPSSFPAPIVIPSAARNLADGTCRAAASASSRNGSDGEDTS